MILSLCQKFLRQKWMRLSYLFNINFSRYDWGMIIRSYLTSPPGVIFKVTADLHTDCWMARLIYGFKLFLFGRTKKSGYHDGHFELNAMEKRIRNLLSFAIGQWIYESLAYSSWPNIFTTERSEILERLKKYSSINKPLAYSSTNKFVGHLL